MSNGEKVVPIISAEKIMAVTMSRREISVSAEEAARTLKGRLGHSK